MKRFILSSTIILSALAVSGFASAQRGGGGQGGGGPGSSVHCNVQNFQVKNIANRLQRNSFVIRDAVQNLPRPQHWMPFARPLGQSTRTILSLVEGGQQNGVCRSLGQEFRTAQSAIDSFKQQLHRNGRGARAQDLLRKLSHSERMLNRLDRVVRR